MKDKVFIDTNIYVYFFDKSDSKKQSKARAVVKDYSRTSQTVISFQVIQEFCNLAIGKFKTAISSDDTIYFIKDMMYPYCEVFPSFDLIEYAIGVNRRFEYHYSDSMIIAAAIQSGCKYLYSEDLQHGQVIEGVEIVNPFI